MHLKMLQKEQFKKVAEASDDFIGNKIADRITKVSKTSPQNNSEENMEHDRKMQREKYISPEQRQKIIDYLRLI